MTITIQLFARQAEVVGAQHVQLKLRIGSTVADALAELHRLHPKLGVEAGQIATSVNMAYADRGRILADGDELALIGPGA